MFETLVPELRASFEAAATLNGMVDVDMQVAGHPIRVSFAEPSLQRALMPSLQGLRVHSAEPTLTIRVWGGKSTTFPSVGLQKALAKFPDKVSVVNSGPQHLQYNPDGEILSCIDTQTREAYYYAADADSLPDYEICTPMRMLFNWLCSMHDALMVHAAAVGCDGKGALIIGKSGRGKSTTGLQCLLHGMDYLGDDYVAITGPTPTVAHQLYRGCKVMDDALARLPELRPHVISSNRQSGKNVLILEENMGKLASSLEIVMIIRPRICAASTTSFAPLSPMQAVMEFASSTIMQMPGTGNYMLRELTRFCASIPAYEMAMSNDRAEISGALEAFLLQSHEK